jgi:RimJ/RimL family protein N-acetyltransferase
MRFFPGPLTKSESNALIGRIEAARSASGFSLMAATLKEDDCFIGFLGLLPLDEVLQRALRGNPQVEIGWRLAHAFWGKGLAPEGAAACLDYAWNQLGIEEVVAFTYAGNHASRRVMEKIGMTYDPKGDFAHPKLPADHRISPHVLYRIDSPDLA